MKRKIDGGIGTRLAMLRKQRGFSQAWLAKRIGVSVGTIQAYEHSRARIPSDRLEALIGALKCDPAALIKVTSYLEQ